MNPEFLRALNSDRVLLMDGAMGTELQRYGLKPPKRPEDWNISHPELVRTVHEAYVKAGAEVLLTNTFQANSIAQREQIRDDRRHLAATIGQAIRIARAGTGRTMFVIGDVGPIVGIDGREFAQTTLIDELSACFRDTSPGIDAVLLETCSSARVRFALRRIHQPMLSLTFRKHPKKGYETRDGHTPEWFAERAAKWGVIAVGVNCGLDIDVADCAAIVRRYRSVTDLPLFARPNAGTPTKTKRGWKYPRTPKQMAAALPELLEAGVSMVGGCCGTTPEHIAAFGDVLRDWNRRPKKSTTV